MDENAWSAGVNIQGHDFTSRNQIKKSQWTVDDDPLLYSFVPTRINRARSFGILYHGGPTVVP